MLLPCWVCGVDQVYFLALRVLFQHQCDCVIRSEDEKRVEGECSTKRVGKTKFSRVISQGNEIHTYCTCQWLFCNIYFRFRRDIPLSMESNDQCIGVFELQSERKCDIFKLHYIRDDDLMATGLSVHSKDFVAAVVSHTVQKKRQISTTRSKFKYFDGIVIIHRQLQTALTVSHKLIKIATARILSVQPPCIITAYGVSLPTPPPQPQSL